MRRRVAEKALCEAEGWRKRRRPRDWEGVGAGSRMGVASRGSRIGLGSLSEGNGFLRAELAMI